MHDQLGPTRYGIMRHLTLDEIRATLGEWFSIIPPEGARR
jgi:predicted SAM-dependent methyltransferase